MRNAGDSRAHGHAGSPVASAKTALAEVMAYYGREMTTLESVGWLKLIDEFGDVAIVRYLTTHMERSAFAPKLNEAIEALRPGMGNAVAGFEALQRCVKRYGPYQSPVFDDPAIPAAVLLLGGWIAVNEQMPEPSDRFAYDALFKRFEACYRQACAQQMLHPGSAVRLANLHSKQLQLAAPSAGARS